MALADLWTAYALAAIAAGHGPREAVDVANQMVSFEVQREAATAQSGAAISPCGEERKNK
jgi:hypothetical protein